MDKLRRDPFRLYFPLGIFFLLWGILLWLPQIWVAGDYPVLLHRSLVLNGFMASFIGGFLMTAAPRFSRTPGPSVAELAALLLSILTAVAGGFLDSEIVVGLGSLAIGIVLLVFLVRRIIRRKANPPYSFIFLFVGLGLWIIAAVLSLWDAGMSEVKELQYHGAVMAIILGVGTRLLPGILGHTEIVISQRERYEGSAPFLSTVPKLFFLLMGTYVVSFFLPGPWRPGLSAGVVLILALAYWKLWRLPKEKTALTLCLWTCAWLIVLSYVLRGAWPAGMIHGSHAFFINGLVLLSLLIATRVIRSHGNADPSFENRKTLYLTTGLIFLASVTRVTAYVFPESYLHHLGYGSLLLSSGVILWSAQYLPLLWPGVTVPSPSPRSSKTLHP